MCIVKKNISSINSFVSNLAQDLNFAGVLSSIQLFVSKISTQKMSPEVTKRISALSGDS